MRYGIVSSTLLGDPTFNPTGKFSATAVLLAHYLKQGGLHKDDTPLSLLKAHLNQGCRRVTAGEVASTAETNRFLSELTQAKNLDQARALLAKKLSMSVFDSAGIYRLADEQAARFDGLIRAIADEQAAALETNMTHLAARSQEIKERFLS